jgi:hypothetical protein
VAESLPSATEEILGAGTARASGVVEKGRCCHRPPTVVDADGLLRNVDFAWRKGHPGALMGGWR